MEDLEELSIIKGSIDIGCKLMMLGFLLTIIAKGASMEEPDGIFPILADMIAGSCMTHCESLS